MPLLTSELCGWLCLPVSSDFHACVCPACRHVVFGEVVEGYNVVEAIEANPVDRRDAPVKPVTIREAGEL